MADADIVARMRLNAKDFTSEFANVVDFTEAKAKRAGSVIATSFGSTAGQGIRSLAAEVPVLGNTLTLLNGSALLAAGGIGLVALAIGKAISITEDYEKATRQLDAVLKATGNTTGYSAQQLKDYAEQLETTLAIPAEELLKAETALSSFAGVSGSTFKRAIADAADLAAVYGGDLSSNTEKLGVVLQNLAQGNVEGLRKGFKFLGTDALTTIESMAKLGDTAAAQGALLDALEAKVGGAGAASASGLSGAIYRLGDAAEDTARKLAQSSGIYDALVGMFNDAATAANNAADSAARYLDNLAAAANGPKLPQTGGVVVQFTDEQKAQLSAGAARDEAKANRDAAAAIDAKAKAQTAAAAAAERSRKAAEAEAKARAAVLDVSGVQADRFADVASRMTALANTNDANLEEYSKKSLDALVKGAEEVSKQQDALAKKSADQFEYVANSFYDVLDGRGGDFWNNFASIGKRTLAELAAQFALTGQINIGGTSGGQLISSLLGGSSGSSLLGSGSTLVSGATKLAGLLGIGGSAGAGLLSAGAGLAGAATAGVAGLSAGAGLLGTAGATIGGLSLGGGALATGGLAAASGVGLASAGGVGGAAIAGGAAGLGGLGAAGAALAAAAPYLALAAGAAVLVSQLVKKDPYSDTGLTTNVSGVGGSTKSRGSGSSGKATELTGDVSAGLQQVAQQLGGTIAEGIRLGSIGTNKDKFYYNPTGGGFKASGTQTYATAEAAASAAINDAISKGAITGLTASMKNLLSGGGDLSARIAKATQLQTALKSFDQALDPTSAAVDALGQQFTALRDLMLEAGASTEELAKASAAYDKQLAAIKESTTGGTGALTEFLQSLKVGSNSPLSLRDQEAAARSAYDAASGKIGSSSFDSAAFIAAGRALIDVSRQINGSTDFSVFNQVQAQTNAAIAASSSGAEGSNPFAKKTADATAATADNTSLTAELLTSVVAQLQILNSGGGGSGFIGGGSPGRGFQVQAA